MNNEITEFLEKNGKYLEESLGLKEWALQKKDAIELLSILDAQKIPCLGGDVFLKSDGALKSTVDSWYFQKPLGVSTESYVHESVEVAKKYIEDYPEDDAEYYYVLVY